MIPQIKKAKEYFYEKKYKEALEIFENCQELYYSGLCSLLLKDEQKAKDYFEKSCSYSPSSQWGLAVLDLIHLKRPKKRPSFFQTRAFLEIYISLFIENGLIEGGMLPKIKACVECIENGVNEVRILNGGVRYNLITSFISPEHIGTTISLR